MPVRRILLAWSLSLLVAATAHADTGGGVAVPTGGTAAADGGGAAVGTPVPASTREARIRARRRAAARRRRAAALAAGAHAFPVAGAYTLGGEEAAFAAPRSGHLHMGHDISAARGTPVVAPYAGVVEWVRYQRSGAGHYIVLDADDELDYVFMHLRRGSILVAEGQRVAAGEQLAEVGQSGRSFGPHLHFEVWVGGWYEKGGAPVDPLPLLEDWATR